MKVLERAQTTVRQTNRTHKHFSTLLESVKEVKRNSCSNIFQAWLSSGFFMKTNLIIHAKQKICIMFTWTHRYIWQSPANHKMKLFSGFNSYFRFVKNSEHNLAWFLQCLHLNKCIWLCFCYDNRWQHCTILIECKIVCVSVESNLSSPFYICIYTSPTYARRKCVTILFLRWTEKI